METCHMAEHCREREREKERYIMHFHKRSECSVDQALGVSMGLAILRVFGTKTDGWLRGSGTVVERWSLTGNFPAMRSTCS